MSVQPTPGESPATLEEMAMLVRVLARALRKADPGSERAQSALNYLKRKGLQGSVMRTPEGP